MPSGAGTGTVTGLNTGGLTCSSDGGTTTGAVLLVSVVLLFRYDEVSVAVQPAPAREKTTATNNRVDSVRSKILVLSRNMGECLCVCLNYNILFWPQQYLSSIVKFINT